MLNTVVLAVVLGGTIVISNVIVTLVTMKLFTSPKFLRGYAKKVREVCEVLSEEGVL